MATRSLIGQEKNGIVTFVYCHNDGYPKGVGEDLKNYYPTEKAAAELISKGDRSYVAETPDDGPYTMFGESYEDTKPRTLGVDEFRKYAIENVFVEYFYVFKDGQWECYDRDGEQVTDF